MFDSLFTQLSDLPVCTIADNVADYYVNQMIPIVTSEVASGKTMLLPAACAAKLDDDPIDQVVYVLEPTRFLSNNAADSLRSILGPEGENLIGCLNSNRSDDPSILHPRNRVVFTTVGYALAAGILASRSNFIIDEAHETSIELSLTKAYLHHRLQQGDKINLAVLSATIDVENEMTYWGDAASHFTTTGNSHPVEMLHRPAHTLAEAVNELVSNHGTDGILVFVAGVEEIEEAVQQISMTMMQENRDFEIMSVHGNSTTEQRRAASRDPQASIKILVGTNVLESGVNLSWVNGGVSSGDTKIMYAKGNLRRLNKEELPRWRIKQQSGRCGRFRPGTFILAHPTPLLERPDMQQPDIKRLPLTELVMHCTSYPDIHVRDLVFSPNEQPKPEDVSKAIETLVLYGLIEEEDDGTITLTEEGELIQPLPLSYRASAALCEANRLNMVAEMLPLVAMLDIGDCRFNFREKMIGGHHESSDVITQLQVLTQNFYFRQKNHPDMSARDMAETCNVNLKKFHELHALVRDLQRKTNVQARWSCYLPIEGAENLKQFDQLTKQVIFRGMIAEAYPALGIMSGVSIPSTESKGAIFTSAQFGNTSVCSPYHDFMFITANTRVVMPKRGMPFAVSEMITTFTVDDMKPLIKRFGRSVFERIAAISRMPTSLNRYLEGKLQPDYDEVSYVSSGPSAAARRFSELFDDRFSSSPALTATKIKEDKPVQEEPKKGSLGDLLTAALASRQ